MLQDKENEFRDNSLMKTRLSPTIPLKDSANVTVTLTLTSAAADDVLGVLRNLGKQKTSSIIKVLQSPTPVFDLTGKLFGRTLVNNIGFD